MSDKKKHDSPHPEIVSGKDANKPADDAISQAQWAQAKALGLLDQKGVEHDGLNSERPKGN